MSRKRLFRRKPLNQRSILPQEKIPRPLLSLRMEVMELRLQQNPLSSRIGSLLPAPFHPSNAPCQSADLNALHLLAYRWREPTL
jgi:hypothetical protein